MLIFSKEALLRSWKKIYRDKPAKKRKKSRGIDNISIQDFKARASEYLNDIYRQLEGGFFKFTKLKKFPLKKGKKIRDIQAPIIADRIVQKIINDYLLKELTPVFEQAGVVGSVQGTSVRKVVCKAYRYSHEGYHWVLKTDIKSYFPSIDKERMHRIAKSWVTDPKALSFINQYLNISKEPGIPQGTPLSPLMANLYLLEFDRQIAKRENIKHFRYIDDVLVFCRTEKEAVQIYKLIRKSFSRLGLKIHRLEDEGKTLIRKFDSGELDVLGIVYKRGSFLIKKKKLISFKKETIKPLCWKQCLQDYTGSDQEKAVQLIEHLNHRILGWGGVYAFCDVAEEYKKIDNDIRTNLTELFHKLKLNPWEIDNLLNTVKKLSNIKLKPIASYTPRFP